MNAVAKHTLAKPIFIDEGAETKELKVITLDFSKQTGADLMQIETEMMALGQGRIGIDNTQFILRLAAKASDLFPEDIQKLCPPDFMEVFYLTRNFILGYWGLTESEDSESSSGSSENSNPELLTGKEKQSEK